MSGLPDPKSRSLARGERRYRRKVASAKDWQRIVAAKQGPSRVHPQFVLAAKCDACNRVTFEFSCALCSKIERAERDAGGAPSKQMVATTNEYHHVVPRSQGGDDVEDNIVPLSREAHRRVTNREPDALAALAASPTPEPLPALQKETG